MWPISCSGTACTKCSGLFVLLLVGVMLLAKAGTSAHLAFFGYPVEPMAKSTFYFVVAALSSSISSKGATRRRSC
jgi:hypothetical protein